MADAPKILGTDTLRQAYPKLNQAIDKSNEASLKSDYAEQKSNDALGTAKRTEAQLDTIVVNNGESDAEVLQARVDVDGKTFPLLKDHLYSMGNAIKDRATQSQVNVISQKIVEVDQKFDPVNQQISTVSQKVDSSQRFKITKDDGSAKSVDNSNSGGTFNGDILALEAGPHNFNVTIGTTSNLPPTGLSNGTVLNAQIDVKPGVSGRKTIYFVMGYDNREFRGVVHSDGNFRGWREVVETNGGSISDTAIVQQLQADMATRVTKQEAGNWQQFNLTLPTNGQSKSLGSYAGDVRNMAPGFWEGFLAENATMKPSDQIAGAPTSGMIHANVWQDFNRKVIEITFIHANKTYRGTQNTDDSGGWRGWKDMNGDEALADRIVAPADYFASQYVGFAEKVKNVQTMNSVTFGFITDTHYATVATNRIAQKRAGIKHIKNICEINKYVGFDFKVHGGDLVDGDQAKSGNAGDITESLRHFFDDTCPSFVVKGNHDDGSWFANRNGNLLNEVLDPFGMYLRAMKPSEKYSISYSGDPKGYFYYDMPDKKTRVICLNSYDTPYIANSDGTNKYVAMDQSAFSGAQINWLANEALNTQAGWKVIFFTHAPLNGTTHTSNQINGDAILGLIEAYKAGASFSKSSNVTDFAYSVNKTFSQAGDVIAVISGHLHRDISTVRNGILHISCLNSFAAQDHESSPARTMGAYSEEAFDVFVIDFDSRTLHAKRYGAGTDRQFSF